MRNLRVVQDHRILTINDLPVSACAWDLTSNGILAAFGPSEQSHAIQLRKFKLDDTERSPHSGELVATWDVPSPIPDVPHDKIINLQHFAHNDTSYVVLAGGDVVKIQHRPLPGEPQVEIVGTVDEGIRAAAWSPDEELIVLVTCANTLLFMSTDFDNIASAELKDEDAKLSKHVSVGWGKKETQFHGKRAKALRDPTMPERVDEGQLSSVDQGQTTISWRGDGAYVAVNSILGTSERRIIRVYTREGILDSVTEPTDGMEGSLSWRPAGNLITAVKRADDEAQIIFFERNGLRHGQFPLRCSKVDLQTWASSIELAWNNDSTVLAVAFLDRIQLWTMGNYHYYLKQELRNSHASILSGTFKWNPENNMELIAVDVGSQKAENTSPGAVDQVRQYRDELRRVQMTWTVSRGCTDLGSDLGTVLVIDGAKLKVTPLRKTNIPPPMALHEIDLKTCIKDVAVNKSNSLIAALHETCVSLVQCNLNDRDTIALIESSVDLPIDIQASSLQISCTADRNVHVLYVEEHAFGIWDVNSNTRHSLTAVSVPATIFPSTAFDRLYASLGTSIAAVDAGPQVVEDSPFADTIEHAEVVEVDGQTYAVYLSRSGALRLNGSLLLKGCTSFCLTASHIVYTTVDHLIKFIALSSDTSMGRRASLTPDLIVPPDTPSDDESCRTVERGAKLVTVIPTAYSVILQMPRGNLETIYPRALVLASIRENLNQKRYRKAFMICRSQRVDMNILCDHNPEQFLGDIPLVIEQLKTVEFIDLFLSQLRGNESDPAWAAIYQAMHYQEHGADVIGKVNAICQEFLKVLSRSYKTFLQSMITANVCQHPPNIDAGLHIVADLRLRDGKSAESALEHMCFLVDINQVYDHALGLYDLDLTRMVAQRSQKDPREYGPYLESLQAMEQLRRQYTINNDLKRYGAALADLQSLDVFAEAKAYISKHGLYTAAFELYKYEQERKQEILRLYADFLVLQKSYKAAAIVYESVGDLTAALAQYRSANLWQSALSTAKRIPVTAEEINTMAVDFASSLTESKEHAAAARVSLDYLHDVDGATASLCKAFQPNEAIRIATVHDRLDLLATTVDDGIRTSAASLMELLADCKSQTLAQTTRLAELRVLQTQDPLRFLTGESTANDNNIPDDMSIAASTTASLNPSLFTRYGSNRSMVTGQTAGTNTTNRTGKNRRREERKRARGKKGTIYEEEYLVGSIGRVIERIEGARADVAEVVEACLRRGMRELGKALEQLAATVVDLLIEKSPAVFASTNGMPRPPGADSITVDQTIHEDSVDVRLMHEFHSKI